VLLSLLEILACPDCGGDLKLVQGDPAADGVVVNGMLECERCTRSFVVQRRIPQLLPKHLDKMQRSEMAARDEQVDDFDNNIPLFLFGLAEIPFTLQKLGIGRSDRVLDAGCGTGRMSEKIAAGAKELIAVDFSFKSLLQNDIKLQASGATNYHLIQADICHLPLKSLYFDRVVSSQVLEHLPTDALQRKAIQEMNRVAKFGASIVVTAYRFSRWSKEKQGEHDGGIPFIRFTEEELISLLTTALTVDSISGILVYVYVALCSKPIESTVLAPT